MSEITYERIEMEDPLYQQERELRNKVLLRPIGLPDFHWEMNDGLAVHFVALQDEEVVGCALLFLDPNTPLCGRLMQMAVDPALQGQGVGKELVLRLLDHAKQQRLAEVICRARDSVVPFYEKLGFLAYGEPFDEVGLPHTHMRITLANHPALIT